MLRLALKSKLFNIGFESERDLVANEVELQVEGKVAGSVGGGVVDVVVAFGAVDGATVEVVDRLTVEAIAAGVVVEKAG